MNSKLIYSAILAFGFIVGWNIFLIERDAKLFEAYDSHQVK